MKHSFNSSVALLLAIVIIIGSITLFPISAAENTVITLYHTNDTHGRVDKSVSGNYDNPIGIASIAAIKANTENSILCDAGDAIHGTPIAILSQGAHIISLMNAAGYDYMAVGNHEFDYGYERLLELAEMADFPILSSNIRNGNTYDFDETQVKEIAGIKIGFFGLSTEHTPDSTMPSRVEGLTFESCVEAAEREVAELNEIGVDIIVAICHMGEISDDSGTTSDVLAQSVEGIDVIIDGHSHSTYQDGLLIDNTLIVSANQYENYLGKVTLEFDSDRNLISKTAALLTADDIAAIELSEKASAVKAEVSDTLALLYSDFSDKLIEKVGHSEMTLSAERAPGVRTMQTDIGYLVAEAYRTAVGADIGIANGGDIRTDIIKGDLTYGDLISVLPFFNSLQVKEITPAILKSVLENGVSYIVCDKNGKIDHTMSQSGRFPNVAGFSFDFDPTLPVGERIISITLDGGEKLDLADNKTLITLGASSFVLSGGDDYSMLAELPVIMEAGFTAEQALIDYIAANAITAEYFHDNNVGRSNIVSINNKTNIIFAPIALSLFKGQNLLVP